MCLIMDINMCMVGYFTYIELTYWGKGGFLEMTKMVRISKKMVQ